MALFEALGCCSAAVRKHCNSIFCIMVGISPFLAILTDNPILQVYDLLFVRH